MFGWRKTSFLVILLFLFSSVSILAQDKQAEGIALLRHAVELTDVRQSGPYHRRTNLTVSDYALGKQQGVENVYFVSPQQWRRELRLKDYYDESAFFIGTDMYRIRSQKFTPPAARKDVAGSLRNLPEALDYRVLRIFSRKVNDSDARCVYLQQQKKDHPDEITWCFDPTSGLPTAEIYGDYGTRVEFRDYKAFGKKFMPGSIEFFVRGKSVDKAVTEVLEEGGFDPAKVIKVPDGVPARPWCDDMQSPVGISTDRPDVPQGARSHSGLELIYEVTTDANGNVANVVPMSSKPFADRIVMQTLAGWKFKPARCGTTPVPTDFVVNLQQ